MEAFVVSRVDGTTSVAEIAEETNQSAEAVLELLERLSALGVIVFEEPRVTERPRPAPARPSGAFRLGPIVEAIAAPSNKHPAAALYDPGELDEEVDIDLPRRRQILDLYYKLDQLTHYELFGVEPSAEKKAIKLAYYQIVNVFHPDRYFGKKLGSFKPKLEKVFARLTESYDVLSRSASRTEYDAYLRAQSKTRAFDAGATDSVAHQAALAEVERRIQAEASAEARGQSIPPPGAASSRPPAAPPGLNGLPPRTTPLDPALRPSSHRPSDPEIRRRALARKLGRSGTLPNAPAPSPAPEPPNPEKTDAQRHEWAASELKRRYDERMQQARSRQVETYTRAASDALARGDTIGAANALRIAASLDPDNQELAVRLTEVAGKASSELASSYLEQAEYEEREQNYLAAAKSYVRAAAGKPQARLFERAAHCLLAGDGDLREAGEMARKAVMLDPENARHRLTLARFYLKAGHKKSAEGELTRAATLAPKDDTITDWINKLRRDLG